MFTAVLARSCVRIQARHFEPLLYSTVYGLKIRKLFTLYYPRGNMPLSHNYCGRKTKRLSSEAVLDGFKV